MTAQSLATHRRPAPWFLLPPPLYFGLAFAAGMVLHHFVPLSLGDFPGRVVAGAVLLVAGVVFGPLLAAAFLARRTTLNPFGAPSVLMTGGVYRVSRNPMYLGVLLIYLGGCVLVQSLWPLPLLVFPLAILDRVVIPFEEASMRSAFGAAYDAYCSRVRRWL
jgi:protein-S-isoprenylcysteine O-methyltransferase Ste14